MASMKEMIEYGYKWIGVIPLNSYGKAYAKYMTNKPVLILYPDNTETYVEDTLKFFKEKDTVMYALERNEKEIKLIQKAILSLREFANDTEKSINQLCKLGRYEVWQEVLNILGFSDEDILVMVNEAELNL